MQRFETTTCYHCSAESTGREHVPPKCLFPKGGNWSGLITVPSCAAHNNANSKADEYLKFLLGAIASNTPSSITKSAARGIVRLAKMGSGNLHRYGIQRDDEALVLDKDFPLDFELLRTCLEKVARAIYFHHHSGRQKLLGRLHVWPLFIPIDGQATPEFRSAVTEVQSLTTQRFEQNPKLGLHQEIFAYQVHEEAGSIVVNMEFYKQHHVSVMGIAK